MSSFPTTLLALLASFLDIRYLLGNDQKAQRRNLLMFSRNAIFHLSCRADFCISFRSGHAVQVGEPRPPPQLLARWLQITQTVHSLTHSLTHRSPHPRNCSRLNTHTNLTTHTLSNCIPTLDHLQGWKQGCQPLLHRQVQTTKAKTIASSPDSSSSSRRKMGPTLSRRTGCLLHPSS